MHIIRIVQTCTSLALLYKIECIIIMLLLICDPVRVGYRAHDAIRQQLSVQKRKKTREERTKNFFGDHMMSVLFLFIKILITHRRKFIEIKRKERGEEEKKNNDVVYRDQQKTKRAIRFHRTLQNHLQSKQNLYTARLYIPPSVSRNMIKIKMQYVK